MKIHYQCSNCGKRFAVWKAKQQKAREKKKKDKPYRSDTMAKSIKKETNEPEGGKEIINGRNSIFSNHGTCGIRIRVDQRE